MSNKFEGHVNDWKDCRDCSLCETRNRVVFRRGPLPCDILFVGEAPGVSEDTLGKPFIGKAGALLDEMIAMALGNSEVRIAFTNLVSCLPVPNDEGIRIPEKKSITACKEKLFKFVGIAKPDTIVTVGKLSTKYVTSKEFSDIQFFDIIHPAAILSMSTNAQKIMERKRTVLQLEDVFASITC